MSVMQRTTALSEANRIRLGRAEVKRQIRRGDVVVRDVLLDPPECVLSMRVADLLGTQYRWGVLRVERVMGSFRISPDRRVGELTVRQREVLSAELEVAA